MKVYSKISSHITDEDGFGLDGDNLSDDQNPKFIFNNTDLGLLLKIARGEINAKDLAIRELINRKTSAALWMVQDAN